MPEDRYFISDDRSLVDLDVVHRFLSEEAYWCKGVPREVVERSVASSMCFSAHEVGGGQVGFARVITDTATFGYIGDVFVLPEHRGAGLGKRLCAAIIGHPELQGFRRWLLGTVDGHGLYAQFGFEPLRRPERFMEIYVPPAELYGSVGATPNPR